MWSKKANESESWPLGITAEKKETAHTEDKKLEKGCFDMKFIAWK